MKQQILADRRPCFPCTFRVREELAFKRSFTPRKINASCCNTGCLCASLCILGWGEKTRIKTSTERKELYFWRINMKPYCLICPNQSSVQFFIYNAVNWQIWEFILSWITRIVSRTLVFILNLLLVSLLFLHPSPPNRKLCYIFFFLRTCLHCSEAQDWSRLAVRKLEMEFV